MTRVANVLHFSKPDPAKKKGTDLKKLSVKELRGILARWDDPCAGCAEKDNFLMKIAENRETYGDMEVLAQSFAHKARKATRSSDKGSRKATVNDAGSDDVGGDLSAPIGGGASVDDPLCSRMLEMEVAPLQEEIKKLRAENAELRERIERFEGGEELIHEDL